MKHLSSACPIEEVWLMSWLLFGSPGTLKWRSHLMDKPWASGFSVKSVLAVRGEENRKEHIPNLKGLKTPFAKNKKKAVRTLAIQAGQERIRQIVERSRVNKWCVEEGRLSMLIGCHGTTFSWFSSFFSHWKLLNLFTSLFILKWLSPFFPRLMTLLSARVLFSAFTVHPLYLCPNSYFILTWLLAVHLYLWHYILSLLDTKTVSSLFQYFLKCLACTMLVKHVTKI